MYLSIARSFLPIATITRDRSTGIVGSLSPVHDEFRYVRDLGHARRIPSARYRRERGKDVGLIHRDAHVPKPPIE